MKIIQYKHAKETENKLAESYIKGYLQDYSNVIVKGNSKTNINDLPVEQLNCIIDCCSPNFFVEVTDGELKGIYKQITSAFSALLNIKEPTLNFHIVETMQLKWGEYEMGRLSDSNNIDIFVPVREYRKKGIKVAPFLHLDIVNAIIHELWHIKVNNKIYEATKKCVVQDDNGVYSLNFSEFYNLGNIEQMLVWQNLSIEVSKPRNINFNDYYDYGLEETFVRLNTLITMENITEINCIEQASKDEVIKYLNFMLFDEYYNGKNEISVMGQKVNKMIFKALEKARDASILAKDLVKVYPYIDKIVIRGVNDYIGLRINHLQEQKLNLAEIMQNNGLEDIDIKDGNNYILNYLYALYYRQGNYKMAKQILKYNLKVSDISTAVKNAIFAYKFKNQKGKTEQEKDRDL